MSEQPSVESIPSQQQPHSEKLGELGGMTPALQSLSRSEQPMLKEDRIEMRQGICGGNARIRGTRITVWGLEDARRHGFEDATLLEMYPSVSRADLEAAWEYVGGHVEEIDRLIRENEEA